MSVSSLIDGLYGQIRGSYKEICDALRCYLTWTHYCQFYLALPILSTAWRELRWSHFNVLMRANDATARHWYARDADVTGKRCAEVS